MQRRWSQALFCGIPRQDRANEHTLKHRRLCVHTRKHCHCEQDRALALGGTGCPEKLWGFHPCRYQKSSGRGVGKLAEDGPA